MKRYIANNGQDIWGLRPSFHSWFNGSTLVQISSFLAGGGENRMGERGAGELTIVMAWFMKMLVSLGWWLENSLLLYNVSMMMSYETLALFILCRYVWHLQLFLFVF